MGNETEVRPPPCMLVQFAPREWLPWPMVVAMRKHWQDLSPTSRLLAAKFTAVAFDVHGSRLPSRRLEPSYHSGIGPEQVAPPDVALDHG
jgi:hypothetical protein